MRRRGTETETPNYFWVVGPTNTYMVPVFSFRILLPSSLHLSLLPSSSHHLPSLILACLFSLLSWPQTWFYTRVTALKPFTLLNAHLHLQGHLQYFYFPGHDSQPQHMVMLFSSSFYLSMVVRVAGIWGDFLRANAQISQSASAATTPRNL